MTHCHKSFTSVTTNLGNQYFTVNQGSLNFFSALHLSVSTAQHVLFEIFKSCNKHIRQSYNAKKPVEIWLKMRDLSALQGCIIRSQKWWHCKVFILPQHFMKPNPGNRRKANVPRWARSVHNSATYETCNFIRTESYDATGLWSIWRNSAHTGELFLIWPREYGGSGGGFSSTAQSAEESWERPPEIGFKILDSLYNSDWKSGADGLKNLLKTGYSKSLRAFRRDGTYS